MPIEGHKEESRQKGIEYSSNIGQNVEEGEIFDIKDILPWRSVYLQGKSSCTKLKAVRRYKRRKLKS